jgi:hypothetical protein
MPWLVTEGASIVHATFFVALLLTVAMALGVPLLRALGVTTGVAPTEKAVLALGLGVGALQFVPFLLGVMGHLNVSLLRIAFAAIALAVSPIIARMFRSAPARFASMERPERWQILWLAALLPLLTVVALLALTPTLDPDGLAYHLTAPKRWLASGSVGYLPTYFVTNAPMGVEMLFTIALALDGDAAAKFLHFALGCWGAVGLYCTGLRCGSKVLGAAAATLYLAGPLGIGPLLGCAYLEGVTGFAMIAAGLAWVIWYRAPERPWLRTAALLAGIGVSFKLTSGLFPVALAGCSLAKAWEVAGRRPTAFLRLVWGLAPITLLIILPVAPWLVRSALLTGNPFFPMFASLIPSRDYSPEIAAQSELYNRYLSWASQAGAAWSLEMRKKIILGAALAFVAVTVVAWLRVKSFMGRATAVVLLVVALVQLVSVGLYGRYWMPLLGALAMPLLLPFERIWAHRLAPWVLVVFTATASLAMTRSTLARANITVATLVRTVVGLDSQRDFLLEHLPLYPAYEQANRELAPDARVLLAHYCGGFYLDRQTYCSEFAQDALRVKSFPAFASDLLRLRVTHVLAPVSLAGDGPWPPLLAGSAAVMIRAEEDRVVNRLLRDYGHLLGRAADQGLFAVDRSGLAGALGAE